MSAARQLPAQGDRSTPLARVLELLVDAFAERIAAALDRILRDRAAQADEAWAAAASIGRPADGGGGRPRGPAGSRRVMLAALAWCDRVLAADAQPISPAYTST